MKRIVYLIIVSLLVMGLVLTGCPPSGPALQMVTIKAIPGVTAPATGGTPVTAITATDEYTGTVVWSPAHDPFEAEIVYTATIRLEAKAGYTFSGVPADSFTVAGATTVINSAGSNVVAAQFPATAADPEPEPLFTIIRDSFGVPHVYAETKEALAFGAGYAMAQDRLWQADILRRTASGRLSELLGPARLAADKKNRERWYNQDELKEIYDKWNPGTGYEHLKPMIEAYVEGINLYIYEALLDPSLMPIEYVANRLIGQLEDFAVEDVVAVTVLMAWQFGGTGGNEGDIYKALLALQGMHGEQLGGAVWSDLFPLNDPGAPVTIPDQVYEEPEAAASMAMLDFPEGLGDLFEEYAESRAAQDELLESLGIPAKFGSNALLVRPALSATGNALQLGGPQMGHSVPQIVYEIGLHGAGINAVGMAFPGAGPFILIGVSEYGAWSSTTGASDVVDIRVLVLNEVEEGEDPTHYLYDGAWLDLEVRTETFGVRGLAEPVTATFYRSDYGPIVHMDKDARMAITLHTRFYRNEIGAEQGWQLFQEATDIYEFEAAVEMIWPSHNFVWTDTDGNIGYWHAGRFPVKPEGADPRLPLMGDGSQEWVRVTGPDEMPRSINPTTQDWLANWNNKPIADWPYAESDFHWGEGHRVGVLMQTMPKLLALAGNKLTTAHLNMFNQAGGYHHTAGMNFVARLIGVGTAYAQNTGDAEVAAALLHLGAWATATPPASYVDLAEPMWPFDENPTYDHAGLTIFDAWYERIVPKVFDRFLPPEEPEEADWLGRVRGNHSLLLRILREDESLLYPLYPKGEALNALIVEALKEAIADLKGEYGEEMSEWLTPVLMQNYDVMGALPGVNPLTGQPLHPMMNRGTYNHIAELSKPLPQGGSVIPPGQSGFMELRIVDGRKPTPIPSDHAYDQVLLYATWTYKPMHLTREAVEAVATWQREFFLE